MKKSSLKGTPSGFRDIGPEESALKRWVVRTIEGIYMRYGFVPIETPIVEFAEILADEVTDFNLFMVSPSKERQKGTAVALAMRFDQTVPLARFVSENSAITKPFKRYVFGPVFRGESPQAGRYRQFDQFDADIVGSNRTIADAEIISLMYETLTALGVTNFKINVNNRKILNGLAAYVGFPTELSTDVLRVIDKLGKIGWEGVESEISSLLEGAFTAEQSKKLQDFVDLRGSNEEVVNSVLKMMKNSPQAVEGAWELGDITTLVDALGVPRSAWQIDLAVARGLGYYTGTVFETTLLDLPSIGSVFSGGRYDDLVSRFCKDSIPAVGASVGVDRLFAALETLKLVPKRKTNTKVVVLNFEADAEAYCSQIVGILRRAGISTELYLGKEKSIKGQLTYALKQEVPVIIIAGGRECDAKTAQVKDVEKRTQVAVPIEQLPEFIKTITG